MPKRSRSLSRYWLPVALLGLGLLLPTRAVAQAYRSSAQAGVTTGVTSLTINRPAGTVNGDLMIAAIAVRPNTATITAPAGWTLIRRTNQVAANDNAQATYRKVAGAAEPASYTWIVSAPTGLAGGIMTFYGVDTATPVDVENGQATASALTHTAPSVTTTTINDMIVTTHSFTSAATWTPPGGMTEAVDVASDAVPNTVGIALEMNYVVQPAVGATGARTATASNDLDAGVAQTVALSRATTATWTGAVNNLWSNGGNWSGLGGLPPVAGDDLIFPSGASNLSNSNNLAAGTSFTSITVSGSGYTLAGNSIVLGTGSLTDGSIAGSNAISLAMSFAATRTIAVSDAATRLTISGVISGAGGLTKAGPGTLALSAANTYTGVTTVSAGMLEVRNNTALGTTAGATTVASGAALEVDGSALLIAEPLTLNGTGVAAGGALRNLANNNTWSGAITLGSASRINSDAGALTVSNTTSGAAQALTVGGAGNTTVSGVIGTTSGTLTKDGAGTLTLSAVNTYTGATTVSAGTVRLGIANAVGANSAVTVAGGATFNLNAFSDVIGSLAGAGSVTSGAAGAVTLTAGGNNTSTTFSGIMQNGTGTVALTKAGTGTLNLSGANTYTGLTTVSAGVLDAENNTALGTTAGATTVANGAALEVDGSGLLIAEPLTLNGTGIAASGVLRNLANSNTWSGAITLATGSRINSDAGTLTVSSTITGATRALTVGGAGNTTLSGVIGTTTGTLTKDGTGKLTLSAANTYTGLTTVSAGVLNAENNTALGTTAGATTVANGAALEVDGSGLLIAEPLTLNGTGIAASGALRNLANSNTWSGAITLATGSRINSDAGTLTVSSTITGATRALTVGGAGNTTLSGVIGTTTGTLTKDGTGKLTLSANNTYTGLTTVGAGTLVVNGSQATSVVSLSGGTLGGTGTVGAITSAALGGAVSPGQGPGILNSGNLNLSTGSPSFVVELNGTTAGTGYDRLNVTGSVNLGGATLTGTVGFATSNGMTFTVITNDGVDAITGTFAGAPEGSTVVLGGLGFAITYVGGTGNDVVLTRAAPILALGSSVLPAGTAPSGTDLTYTLTFTNTGGSAAHALVLTDSVSINADFKLGSVSSSLGSTGLTVLVAYSSDGGSTWTYTPTSGAGGAPAGYDRQVTHLLWTFTGTLPQIVPNNTGSIGFIARIR